jgi:hypothetical protein
MISKAGLSLLLVFASAAFAQGGLFGQTDWSGGSGVQGPVYPWGDTFYTSSHICWDGLPGYILLRIYRVQHMISGDMYGCYYAFPADMDGDGDLDVVASQTLSWDRVMWFENDGAGGGWREHEIAWNHPEVQCAYPGDLDNDGDMDVAGANGVFGGLEWWRNEDGAGNEWKWFGIDNDFGTPNFVCCADIDGDGRLEVVSPSGYSLNQIAWWDKDDFTPPSPPWIKHVIAYGCDGDEIFVVDLDQDGDMDVVSPKYGLCFHDNVDGVGLTWEETDIMEGGDEAQFLHAADVDSDGDMDVVASGRKKDIASDEDHYFLAWFENEGFCNSWETHWIYINTWDVFYPRGVHAADLTEDGLVDIVCAEGSQNWDLTVWRNIDASQNLFSQHILETGPYFRDVDTADFDGDGRLDMLVAASSGGVNIRWIDIDPCLQGSLTSSILDAQGWPEWESIEWTSVEPEGTEITFQIRGSGDPDEMGAWSDTLTEPCSLEGHLDSAYRFIQYRVHLQAEPGAPSPYLEQMLVHFSNMGVEEGGEPEPLALSVIPNPFTALALISVTGPLEGTAVSVYDISGRLVRELSTNHAGAFEWHGLDGSGEAVPPGCYLVRAVRGDELAQAHVIHI